MQGHEHVGASTLTLRPITHLDILVTSVYLSPFTNIKIKPMIGKRGAVIAQGYMSHHRGCTDFKFQNVLSA